MVVGVVAGQPRRHLVERKFGQDRDAVEGLLPVHCDIVAEGFQWLARKGVVDALGLLQADDVRLPLGQPGRQVVDSLLDRVDVPGGDAHGGNGRVRRGDFNCT